MDYKTLLVIIAGCISLYANAIYIRSFFTGKTTPHHYSYIIWTTLSCISFLGQIHDNSGVGAYVLGIMTLAGIVVFLFSLKFRIKNPSRADKIFLVLALISIVPWILLKTPLYSVIMVVFIDAIGYLPILNKIRRMGNSEALTPWILNSIVFILGILSIEHFSILSSLYLFIAICMNLVVIGFILFFRGRENTIPG